MLNDLKLDRYLDQKIQLNEITIATRKSYEKSLIRISLIAESTTDNWKMIIDKTRGDILEKSTFNHYTSMLRIYFNAYNDKYYEELEEILKYLKNKTIKSYQYKPIKQEDLYSLVETVAKNNTRNATIIALLYETGMKVKELINLKKKDFCKKSQEIHIDKRLNKLTDYTAKLVQKSITRNTSEYIIENRFGAPISSRGINYLLITYEINGAKLEYYRFRKDRSETYRRNGYDYSEIKRLMGYSSYMSVYKAINY